MTRNILLVALAAAMATTLGGCSFKAQAPAGVAQCIAEHASPDQIAEMGISFAESAAVRLGRWDAVSCGGGLDFVTHAGTRALVAFKLPELLLERYEFRRGTYAGMLGPGTTLHQRQAAADLGQRMEDFSARRDEALNCLGMQESVLHQLEDADEPFATAVSGSLIGLSDPSVAQAFAQVLIKAARASSTLLEHQSCDGVTAGPFRAYAAEIAQFIDGVHPWAPGCRLEQDASGGTVVCSGAPAPVVPKAK